MLQTSPSVPALRDKLQLDLRPLHAALNRAASVLDVLAICEATAMVHGAGAWVAACTWPHPAAYACAGVPVADDGLQQVLSDMEQCCRTSGLDPAPSFSKVVTTRWRNPGAQVLPSLPREYAQVELTNGDTFCGLLRVTGPCGPEKTECDWDGVEAVVCAAAPHIVICLQREVELGRIDPLTGLCTPAELMARLEREVERARIHPFELALVIMELRSSPDRGPGFHTDMQLRAIGEVVRNTLRSADVACRMPDGRFALLLPMTSQRNALIAAARVMDRLRAHPLLPDDLECQTGVSGWSFEGASAPELLEQASLALEAAREAGARGAFVYL